MAHVLICDDAPELRELMSMVVGLEHDVSTAVDGRDALELLDRDRSIDAVVLDVMMPNLDGFGALRAIRADRRTEQLVVVMLTAKVDEDSFLTAFRAGADGYVTKPFDATALLDLINELLGTSLDERLARREAQLATTTILRQLDRYGAR